MKSTRVSVNTSSVFSSPEFLSCSKKALENIFKMDLLSCCEAEVFETAMKWVRAKSGKNALSKTDTMEHLGDLYYQIRFTSMKVEELWSLANVYDAVLQSDYMAYTKMIATKIAPESYEKYNMNPRYAEWNDNSTKCSFKNGNTRLYRYANKFIMKFTTNNPIILGGFTCGRVGTFVDRAFQDLKSLVLVDVEISEALNATSAIDNSLAKVRAKLHSMETVIMLPHPILVRPGYDYIISIGGLPDGHVFESDSLKSSVTLPSNVEVNVQHPKESFGSGVGLIQALAVNQI